MYVRTPKRYRGIQRRNVFSCRRILLNLLMVAVIAVGIGIYQNRQQLQPIVGDVMSRMVGDVQVMVATVTAPTATPTMDPRNNLAQADTYWANGSITEALRLYRPILESVPNEVEYFRRVGQALLVQGDYAQALRTAEDAITADPYSSDAWVLRAWAQRGLGQTSNAIVSALHALELDRENADALAQLAFAYLDAGQPERALTTADRAISLDPNNYNAHRARAYINWEGLFDFDAAQIDLETAYSLAQQRDPAAETLLGIDFALLQIRVDSVQGAIATLEGLLEVNPENSQALFQLGLIYWNSELRDVVRSGQYLQRCVEVNPEAIDCYFWLGRTQNDQEQTALAAESFARAIELGSQNPQHYWWAGLMQQGALGNCARALEYWREGYELAQQTGRWVEDYEAVIPRCQADFGAPTAPAVQPVPTIGPTPDPANSA